MTTSIYSMDQYYYHKGSYKLKSKFARGLRIGMAIGVLIGGLFVTESSNSFAHQFAEKYTWQYQKTKLTDYIQATNKKVDDKEAHDILSTSVKWGDHFRIDHRLLLALINVESKFDKYAISPAGAMGLTQVLTKVHLDKMKLATKVVGTPEPFDIDTNIFMGAMILRECMNKFNFAVALESCYSGGHVGYASKVSNEFNKLKGIMNDQSV